jgi:hypothetical protein
VLFAAAFGGVMAYSYVSSSGPVVTVEPLPVNPALPTFAEVAKKAGIEHDKNNTYRDSVQRTFEDLKKECNASALAEFGNSVTWFYINAVGEAQRAGVTRIEEAPGWSTDDERIDNYVAALAKAGILKAEHLGANAGRAEGQIPLSVEGVVPRNYPDWAEPPLTLGCKRA